VSEERSGRRAHRQESEGTGHVDVDHRHERARLRDRVIVAIARTATRGLYRSIEVVGTPPDSGPTILAASHLNGFVDPVVLIAEIGHLPRFLAKATLWNNPAARVALNFAGVIPVHRAADGSTAANASMFTDAVDALEHRATLAVFAEGTTHDDPTIRPVRTGVARIALQAAGQGVTSIEVVPIGVTYEDKVALRGRVLIHYGEPIEVPAEPGLLDADGVPDRTAVREFTDRLQAAIESLTPRFGSTEEYLALTAAAQINLRTDAHGDRPPPMADVAADARKLARAEPSERGALVSLVARYEMLRGFVGLDDTTVLRGVDLRALSRRVALLAAVVAVLSPLAVAGLFANLVPLALIVVAGMIPEAPVSKGTIRVLVAAVTFPATWLLLALADAGTGTLGAVSRAVTLPVNALLGSLPSDRAGAPAAFVVLVAVPLMGIFAVLVIGQVSALLATVSRWRTLLDRRGQLDVVRARRDEVVAVTREHLRDRP
jgi:1-acyl-sn-glycerol-3-phosphate acyltransferase